MRELPLFPLGMVPFPTVPLDLQVFEPRYLQLMEDLAGTNPREFGVVAITSGHEVGEDNVHGIATVGCAVRIRRLRRRGPRVLLEALGTWRFDSVEVLTSDTPYLVARVRPLVDEKPASATASGMRLRAAVVEYAQTAGLEIGTIPADPDELTWWLASGGPLSRSEQLGVLGGNREERLKLLIRVMRRESQLLRATDSLPFHGDRRFAEN